MSSDILLHCTVLGSTSGGGHSPRPVVPPKPLSVQGGAGGDRGGALVRARSTGSHCSGTTEGWLASTSLLGGGGEDNGGKSGWAKALTWSSWLQKSPIGPPWALRRQERRLDNELLLKLSRAAGFVQKQQI